jgi:hypothetical protein
MTTTAIRILSTVAVIISSMFFLAAIATPSAQAWPVQGFQFQQIYLHRSLTSRHPMPSILSLKRTKTATTTFFAAEQQPSPNSSDSLCTADSRATSSSSSSTSGPLDRPILAFLDFFALFVFAAIGKASHAALDGAGVLQEAIAVAQTALPFWVAWFTTSFVTGVYQNIDDESSWLAASWKQTTKGWIVAVPLGCVGRGILKGYVPPAPFVIVTMIATLILLGTTRTFYALVAGGGYTKK